PILLGKGGEGYVFTYKDDIVIKIYHNTFNNDNEKYLKSLEKLQTIITNKKLPFVTPQILNIGKINTIHYTLEKYLDGILMEEKFPALTEKEKYKLLKSYYEAMKALNTIEFPNLPYGNILQTPQSPITDTTWQGFLIKMITQRIKQAGERLVKDVTNLDEKVLKFTEVINSELACDTKSLVHADYFVNQVLVNDNNEISAVLDISAHALVGDKRLDVASIFFFDGVEAYTKEHLQYLLDLSIQEYGEKILKYNDIYRLYYSFYFSHVHAFMPEWYELLVRNLNDEELWKRIS
ncbi:MAG: phosphotransferase, partial [Candidatus Levyibacteriota bacterium]